MINNKHISIIIIEFYLFRLFDKKKDEKMSINRKINVFVSNVLVSNSEQFTTNVRLNVSNSHSRARYISFPLVVVQRQQVCDSFYIWYAYMCVFDSTEHIKAASF